MADLALIRAGLAANLGVLGIQNTSAYMLANPTPPSVHVFPAGVEYDLAMARGLDHWTLTVQLFVALSADIGSQVNLDRYLASSGALSVKAAIESDPTLGGSCADASVTSCSGYRQFVSEGRPPYLGVDWTVEVYATGT